MTRDSNNIILGYPLDLLLNRSFKLKDIKNWTNPFYWKGNKNKRNWGGLKIPEEQNPGTGNIVIRGRPGTGKSVLALQIAVHSSLYNDDSFSVYVSLEETPEQVQSKAESFDWGDTVRPLRFLGDASEFSTPEDYGKMIVNILTQPDDCPMHKKVSEGDLGAKHVHKSISDIPKTVLLTALTPRSLSVTENENKNVFMSRYRQLENLLRGADWLRKQKEESKRNKYNNIPSLRMVCIDSLNVFGNTCLSREEIFRLFDLFKRYQTLGIFIMEEDEGQVTTPDNRINGDIIEYLSDVVISLKADEDADYFMRYFEIVKSRYQHQVYGKHPFKIVNKEKKDDSEPSIDSEKPVFLQHEKYGIRVYPSLHYIVSGTEPDSGTSQGSDRNPDSTNTVDSTGKNPVCAEEPENQIDSSNVDENDKEKKGKARYFGEKTFDDKVLPGTVKGPKKDKGMILMIEGPACTFKQTFALNFLINGLALAPEGNLNKDEKEGVLFIRLHDHLLLKDTANAKGVEGELGILKNITLSKDLSEKLESGELHYSTDGEYRKFREFKSNNKYDRKVWSFKDKSKQEKGIFTEIAFKSGYILPEEFIHEIRYILENKEIFGTISRVVFTDIGLIAVSYPFLKSSRTSGGIFLTTFVHTIRNYGNINLVMTGTTNQYNASDTIIGEAGMLADTIIHTSRRDVFGDSYIVVEADGLSEGGQAVDYYAERVPAVIFPVAGEKPEQMGRQFYVDAERLEGLVGFDTGDLHRPGVTFRTFEEGSRQKEYNDMIGHMLDYTFGHPAEKRKDSSPEQSIQIDSFDSNRSGTMHQSLNLRKNKPLDRTVVSTVDEFFLSKSESGGTPESKDDNLAKGAFVKFKDKNGLPGLEDYIDTISKEKIVYVRPYYGNVLLLAYRIKDDDGIEIKFDNDVSYFKWEDSETEKGKPKEAVIPAHSWSDVKKLADVIYEQIKKDRKGPPYKFDYNNIAATKSCLLLDAIVCSLSKESSVDNGNDKEKQPSEEANIFNDVNDEEKKFREKAERVYGASKEIRNYIREKMRELVQQKDYDRGKKISELIKDKEILNSDSLKNELIAIENLISTGYLVEEKQNEGKKSNREFEQIENSAVCLCWFSQLQDYLHKHPEMTDKIGVCALPGGGFRGEWYLGVEEGSVSKRLGWEIIEILCREEEEYDRYVRGIGLPLLKKFYDTGNYYAWPHGLHISLKYMEKIHRNALTRASIPNYIRFHDVLHRMCDQLVCRSEIITEIRSVDKKKEEMEGILGRLPEQIRMFTEQNRKAN